MSGLSRPSRCRRASRCSCDTSMGSDTEAGSVSTWVMKNTTVPTAHRTRIAVSTRRTNHLSITHPQTLYTIEDIRLAPQAEALVWRRQPRPTRGDIEHVRIATTAQLGLLDLVGGALRKIGQQLHVARGGEVGEPPATEVCQVERIDLVPAAGHHDQLDLLLAEVGRRRRPRRTRPRPGARARRCSTSLDEIISPRRRIASFLRSSQCRYPSSSTMARSPVWNHRLRNDRWVIAGSLW